MVGIGVNSGKDIHTIGKPNTADAVVISTKQSTVFAGGQLVATDGDPVEPHGVGEHADPETDNGSSTVFCVGVPVNRKGDPDTCGHPRATGVTTVTVGP
jgi:uncharacterized Zn-binding protein involved in type VI secretion